MTFMRGILAIVIGASTLCAQVSGAYPDSDAHTGQGGAGAVFVLKKSRPLFSGGANLAWPPEVSGDTGFRPAPASVQRVPVAVTPGFDAQAAAAFLADSRSTTAQTAPTRPKAIRYSDAYLLRRKIHRYASFATVPLFAAEIAVGQKLYNGNGSGSLRSAHSGLAAGIAVLFGVNSVTGVWNLWEARKDPNGRGKRLFHGILMLGADAGFVATGALAPSHEDQTRLGAPSDRRSLHRTVALTSMGVAVASYLYMLLAR